MDVIDGKWIKTRLSGKRGEQARLAEHIGVSADQMAKILSGVRRVQPEEIPRVVSFFDTGGPKAPVQDMFDGLPEDLQAEALHYMEYLKARAGTR